MDRHQRVECVRIARRIDPHASVERHVEIAREIERWATSQPGEDDAELASLALVVDGGGAIVWPNHLQFAETYSRFASGSTGNTPAGREAERAVSAPEAGPQKRGRPRMTR